MNTVGIFMILSFLTPLFVVAFSIAASLFFYRKRSALTFKKASFLILALDIILSITFPWICLSLDKNNGYLEMAAMIPPIMAFFSIIISFVAFIINLIVSSRMSEPVATDLAGESNLKNEENGKNRKSANLVIGYFIITSMSLVGELLEIARVIERRDDVLTIIAFAALFFALIYAVFANLSKRLYKVPILFLTLSILGGLNMVIFAFFMPITMSASARDVIINYLGIIEYFICFGISCYWNLKDLRYFKNQQLIKTV